MQKTFRRNIPGITGFLGSVLTTLSLSANMELQDGGQSWELFLKSFRSVDITDGIICFLFFRFYCRVLRSWCGRKRSARERLCCHIPAALFAFFMVMGFSFLKENDWSLVFGSTVQFLKACIVFLGYYVLFFCCICSLYRCLDRVSPGGKRKECARSLPRGVRWYLDCLHRYPFRTCFLTMLILYIPSLILSYPGILSTDSKNQLLNAYGALKTHTNRLNNHHPIAHTLLLYGCVNIGTQLFSSANVGLFLYTILQMSLVLAAISWVMKLLVECRIPNRYLLLFLGFFAVAPRIQNYMFLAVKDVCFAAFLMIFLVQLYRLLTGKLPEGKRGLLHRVLFVVSVLGVFFFRQDGVYVLLLTFLLTMICCRKNRRLWGGLLGGTFCFFLLYQCVLIPALNIKASNPREAFSIPFQQTARYVRDAADDVTPEQQEAISAILNYDELAELYNPNLSDPVKATYNDEATAEELIAYFRAWFQMLCKHPGIYVQATMNNLYGYFYPDGYTAEYYDYTSSAERMTAINESLAETTGTELYYPESLAALRESYETFRETLFSLPVLSYFLMPAFYTWCLILWGFYCIRRREKEALLTAVPLFIFLLICMAGPAYGWYFRYLYSLVFCLPGTILIGLASTGRSTRSGC